MKGSNPGRDMPKSLKMVLVAPTYGVELGLVDLTGCGIMSSVWVMILQ